MYTRNFPQSCLLSCSKKKKEKKRKEIGLEKKKKKKPCFYPGSGQTLRERTRVDVYAPLSVGNVTPSVVIKKERWSSFVLLPRIDSFSSVALSLTFYRIPREITARTKHACIHVGVNVKSNFPGERISFEGIRFETWNRLKFKSLTSFQRNPDISLSLSLSFHQNRDARLISLFAPTTESIFSSPLSRLLAASFCFDRLVVFNEKSHDRDPAFHRENLAKNLSIKFPSYGASLRPGQHV